MAILDNEQTIPMILKDKGYTTAGIHSNPYISRRFGYGKGYDLFVDNSEIMIKESIPEWMRNLFRHIRRLVSPYPYLPASKVNEIALGFLENVKEPFFLWLHYMDTHGPHLDYDKNPFIQKLSSEITWRKCVHRASQLSQKQHELILKAYDSEVAYTIEQVRKLIEGIRTSGLLENTYLVLTADHGEELGEHGYHSHPRRLFDTLIHVPLMIFGPGLPKKKTIDDVVELTSIFPTLCDLVGVENTFNVDGFSLLPLLNGNGEYQKNYAISEASFSVEPKRRGIRKDNWKYFYEDDYPKDYLSVQLNRQYSPHNGECLFDLETDNNEQINIAREHPALCRELKEKIEEILSRDSGSIEKLPQDNLVEDKEITRRLKSLGYL